MTVNRNGEKYDWFKLFDKTIPDFMLTDEALQERRKRRKVVFVDFKEGRVVAEDERGK